MPEVFITGGSGFVGSWIARHLYQKGFHLTLLLRKTSSLALISDLKFHKIVGDLTHPETYFDYRGFDYVIHAGALVRSVRSHDYYRVNTEGTRHLVEFAKKEKVKGFLFLSSITAAGPRGLYLPVSHYGRSKYLAEEIVRASGLPFTILRLPVVYGPGDREGFRLFELLKNNILFLPGHDLQLNLIYIRDLVELVGRIIEDDYFTKEILYASDGQVYLLSDILRIASFLIKTRPITISPPSLLLAMISVILDGLFKNHSMISRDKIREFRFHNWTSPDRLPPELDFRPRFDIEAGLRETLGSGLHISHYLCSSRGI